MKIPLFTHLSLLAAAICGIAAPPAAQAADIIAITDAWDYLSPTDGVDPATLDPDFATTWYNTDGSYDGPGFTNAAGPFSYGGITAIGNTGTFIGVGGTATAPTSGLRYTAYFKKQFTLDQDYNQLILEMILDDGAVIYIDGVERARLNMSSTTKANTTGDTYTMLANNAPDESTYFTPAALGALTAGTHTIAISLHNSETTSSDLGMAARVTLPTIVQTTFAGSPPPCPSSAAARAGCRKCGLLHAQQPGRHACHRVRPHGSHPGGRGLLCHAHFPGGKQHGLQLRGWGQLRGQPSHYQCR